MNIPNYFNALPPYPGGKRNLNSWIFGQLATIIPEAQWSQLTFIDAFSGGGSVSMQAKLYGFKHLISNDFSQRSQLVLKGLIQNQHTKLQTPYFPVCEAGFVSEHFKGSVFSARHTQALDNALTYIRSVDDPTQKALLQILLWKRVSRFVAFGTSIGTSNRPFAEALDGTRSFSDLNPKRFVDGSISGLLTPCWEGIEDDVAIINQGIFPALGSVSTYQDDVFTLLPKITGDILYLDPPYANTLGYNKANEVLDAVLFEKLPDKGESVFTKRVDALSELLVTSRHIPTWVLSYNDKVLSLQELSNLVQQADTTRTIHAFSKPYKHLAHVAKRDNNELLIIATKGQPHD